MSKNLIIGNWKMNLRIKSSIKLVKDIQTRLTDKDYENSDVILCPSYVHLDVVNNNINNKIRLGCQNVFWENDGAYTGEISIQMIKDLGCKYAIIGHSERRDVLSESNKMVNEKIIACLNSKIKPILCIGENIAQKRSKRTKEIIKKQIKSAVDGFDADDVKNIIIAYEPIWAIGTSKPASPQDANNTAIYIKEVIKDLYKNIESKSIRILYGGSVNFRNIKSFTEMDNVDGSLVGGESINALNFVKIVKNSYK